MKICYNYKCNGENPRGFSHCHLEFERVDNCVIGYSVFFVFLVMGRFLTAVMGSSVNVFYLGYSPIHFP